MESATFRKWLADRGCRFDQHEHESGAKVRSSSRCIEKAARRRCLSEARTRTSTLGWCGRLMKNSALIGRNRHAKVHRGSTSHALRDEILTRYGLLPGAHPDYEIDHLIPLCLGGSDDPSNLWAQPRRSIEPKWNAEAKDRLERFICDMVCNRQLDLTNAQKAFVEDWIATYHKYYEAH